MRRVTIAWIALVTLLAGNIGIAAVATIAWRARRGDFSPAYHAPVRVVSLYWHFVDIVWIFLFALIYLPGRAA